MNVLIIGASGELGTVITKELIHKGHHPIIHGFSNTNRLTSLAEELNISDVYISDIRNEENVKELIEKTHEEVGLNSIIYCAGINPTAEKISSTTIEIWENTLAINLTGVFLTLKHAIPILREVEEASIVIVSSIFGLNSPANRGAYSAAKHGLNGLIQSAAKEEAGKIRINSICPGPMWSENVRRIFSKHAKSIGISVEDYIKERHRKIPSGRFLEMKECAQLAIYLIGNESNFITGESIRISGGES